MSSPDFNSLSQFLEGLSEEDLAQRLGVAPATLQELRDQPDFKQWSQSKDPESVSWRYHKDKQRYIVNLSFG
ncbi:MAG: hypothetical protein F6J90_19245 [Moorea sp. SIOASIH]|uniref:hypothetical protein n=1 Tax=Moorena sp. SIOASIH TaxID=2607817 RepID=UPI0013B752A6|nr:hypothetical protein [Moorena sp. SIOASIH]NEO38351.1 hypothetical protein [Moorena sp. SIOASIH]